MGKLYLSEPKLKELRAYLKSVLPEDTLKVIRKLQAEHPDFDFYESTINNRQKYWELMNDELRVNNKQFKTAMRDNQMTYAGEIVNEFIEKHHKKEWQLMRGGFDPTGINARINGVAQFCKENYLEHIDLKDIISAESTDDFVNTYEKKFCDPKLVEISDRIIKYLDSVYQKRGRDNYEIYQQAIREYMITGEPDKLHNILNKDY